jgi:hypothetical protein
MAEGRSFELLWDAPLPLPRQSGSDDHSIEMTNGSTSIISRERLAW